MLFLAGPVEAARQKNGGERADMTGWPPQDIEARRCHVFSRALPGGIVSPFLENQNTAGGVSTVEKEIALTLREFHFERAKCLR